MSKIIAPPTPKHIEFGDLLSQGFLSGNTSITKNIIGAMQVRAAHIPFCLFRPNIDKHTNKIT
jgi:hypothetical protein